MITTIRVRDAVTGKISYQDWRPLSEIADGTIIEYMGERIYAERVEVFPYGEVKLTDWHGQVSRFGSDTQVRIMGGWNVTDLIK